MMQIQAIILWCVVWVFGVWVSNLAYKGICEALGEGENEE